MNEKASEIVSEPALTKARRRKLLIGLGVGAAVLAFLCVVAAVLFIVFDPFGWVRRLLGGGAGAAEVMPSDAVLFVGADLATLQSEEVDSLIATFGAAADTDVEDMATLLEELDSILEEQIGLTISEDVQPWVGQYAGYGLVDLQLDEHGMVESSAWILAIEARDRDGADDFMARLMQGIQDRSGGSFDQSEYEGVTLQELVDAEDFAIARSGWHVLIGPSAQALRGAIDAQRGDSLADAEEFRQAMDPLPAERMLSVFVDFEQLSAMMEGSSGVALLGPQLSTFQTAGMEQMAYSVSITEDGLRVDGVTSFDPDAAGTAHLALATSPGAPTIDGRFPGETRLFVADRDVSQRWEEGWRASADDPSMADIDEAMALLEEEIGIDLYEDLIAYLDGEIAFGLAPATEGMFPETANLPLGLLVLADTSQEEALRETARVLTDRLREDEYTPVEETMIAGLQAYRIYDPYMEVTQLVYGVDQGLVFLATGPDLLEGVFGEGSSLADNTRYQETWRSFPTGQAPVMYLDLEGLLGDIREAQMGVGLESFDETVGFLGPIRVIGATSGTLDDYRTASTIIVFIERLQAPE